MDGTVVFVFPLGVNAHMDSPGTPTGTFNVLSRVDRSLIGTVTLVHAGPNWSRFNWVEPIPVPGAQVGDLLQPAS